MWTSRFERLCVSEEMLASRLFLFVVDGGKKKKKPVVVTKSAEKERQTALRLAQEEAMRPEQH